MKRREFITLLGGAAAAWPLTARAQQAARIPHIVLSIGGERNDLEVQRRAVAFHDAMRELGWTDGRNVRIEERFVSSFFTAEDVRAIATEVVAGKPDAIVTTGAPWLAAMYAETKTIPIVFTLVTDPVSDGFVASLPRPGGNVTGFTIFEHSFAGKWLEILKEAVPGMTRVAVMQNADHPAWSAYLNAIHKVAPGMGVEVMPTPVSSLAEIEPTIGAFARTENGGLIVLPSPIGTIHRAVVAGAALRHRLPSIYSLRMYPASGGLMSYGVVVTEPYRQAATYVDRILKGTKPGELPVQASSKFEMVINLKTAKTLGITVPATMVGRADEVIE
jgi:putative ABC transport system substrate-binding protein